MKDHKNFIRAAKILSRNHPNLLFVLAGKNIEDSNKQLRAWLIEAGLRETFLLLGEQQRMQYIFPALDIFRSFSAWGEGFPNVLGEAMACNIPCITTDVGDSKFVVGKTGIVVSPGSPEALATACSRLIRIGPIKRNKIGKMARQRVMENYSINSVEDNYKLLYDRILRLESI